MKKYLSLIKASMSEGMNLFKVSTKKSNPVTKVLLPIFLAFIIMGMMYTYSDSLMVVLEPINMQYVLLTLFVFITTILTVYEGVYKSGNLLFNCKDDNMLLSLPIKKSTVLFVRVFKLYVFELLYNSLFLLPAIIVYARNMNPDSTFYIVSVIGILLFPIIPILISCLIGTITTFLSSHFKGKSLVQTVISIGLIFVAMYFAYNPDSMMDNIASNAANINNTITKIYYPAGAYIELVNNFSALKLLEFVAIHLVLFIGVIFVLSKVYFKINTRVSAVKSNKSNKKYKIKSSRVTDSLIRKEFNRFINSSVFIVNAAFGLVLFIVGCILISVNFDGVVDSLANGELPISIDYIKNCLPLILLGFITFSSLMTSITSSMISLEGKSFSILKSLPVKPYTIVRAKVLTAVLIMLPFIMIGNIIVFIRFGFDLLSMISIIIASVILPLISEKLGIAVNLKYPRMDAKNDTEVVKQSMSSMISVFIGMGLSGLSIVLIFTAIALSIPSYIVMIAFVLFYGIVYALLSLYLYKTCDKNFNNIVV